MLSKTDIVKELGKSISVYPFYPTSIKGNALNLTVSEYAWSLSSGQFWIDPDDNVYTKKPQSPLLEKCHVYTIREHSSAIIERNSIKQVVLLPYSTTLIESNEVIFVGNNIGGEYHSKVNLVSKGTCHIGTYLEPNYCGQSLVAVQSMSRTPIFLDVDSVFCAITFSYLRHRVSSSLRGAPGGRFEILNTVGITLTEREKAVLADQWKTDAEAITEKMLSDEKYKEFINSERRKSYKNILRLINKQNIIVVIVMCLFIISTYILAVCLDMNTSQTIWVDRFWNVGCSGIIICILGVMTKFFRT